MCSLVVIPSERILRSEESVAIRAKRHGFCDATIARLDRLLTKLTHPKQGHR
jgi:hypothetical protein